jgi:hypothetical protein
MSRKYNSNTKVSQDTKSGLTRREFLTDCALPTMTALTMSPILDGLFQQTNANAEGGPSGNWVRTVHLHLQGGWGFWGTFVGQDINGQIISRETMVNHGITLGYGDSAAINSGLVTNMGAPMYAATVSSFTQGLVETITPAAAAQIRVVKYAARSGDDNTAACQAGLMPLQTAAGMGGLIAAAAGTSNSPSGNGTMPLASDPTSQRISVNRTSDVMTVMAFSRQLSQYGNGIIDRLANSVRNLSLSRAAKLQGENARRFQDLGGVALTEFLAKTSPSVTSTALNPTRDPAMRTAFGAFGLGTDVAEATFLGSTQAIDIQATMIKAALDGNLGPVAFALDGYDYHETALGTTNQRNRQAGQFVGRTLLAAFLKGVTTAVWLTTDGGLSHNPGFTNPADNNQQQYSGDREAYSGAALFVVFAGTPPDQNIAQVGGVDPNNGMLVRNTPTFELRMASAHAFWNIAVMSNKASEAEASLASAGYTRTEIDTLKNMTTLFRV